MKTNKTQEKERNSRKLLRTKWITTQNHCSKMPKGKAPQIKNISKNTQWAQFNRSTVIQKVTTS